jgi:hypothetical protein
MNNTRTLTAMFAVLTAATLVVGTLATTQSASAAYGDTKKVRPQQQDDNNGNSKNGNTITIQKCKQAATQSGWDNDQEQECANTICTHPASGASCVSEGKETPKVTPPPPPKEEDDDPKEDHRDDKKSDDLISKFM